MVKDLDLSTRGKKMMKNKRIDNVNVKDAKNKMPRNSKEG